MSLVFPTQKTKVVTDQPRTHALVIGVGEYLHLPGGPLYRTRPARYSLGLRQLTSPQISAKEFAHWLIAFLNNHSAPLGSVELVLSPAEMAWTPPNGMAVPVEAATFENIQNAFDRWDERCNAHRENIALFYFCGHGIEREHMYLLASDFRANHGRPFENAIDINTTCRAVKLDGRAKAACFLIDACREAPFDLYKSLSIRARTLKELSIDGGRGVPDLQVLKAANFGGQAHAPVGDVSYFTKSLIRCLDGLGAASPFDGLKWRVYTSSLSEAMKKCMERTKVLNDQRGVCSSSPDSWTSTILHSSPAHLRS